MATTQPPSSLAIDAAKYAAYLNGSYNADREAVLDRRHRWMMFAVVALGASSIVSAAGNGATIYLGIATALLGAVDLTFNLSVRARHHAYLRKEYFRIVAAVTTGKCTPDEADARMMDLAAEEEPVYMAAHALAANWAMRAVYGSSKPAPCKVGLIRRIFRHWLRMTDANFTP